MNKPRILVIDDDESITVTLSRFLATQGYDVTVVNNGEDALAEVRTGGYGVILSDIYIDRVTGLDVLRETKAANPQAAVILMTARGSVRTTVDAEAGGAFDYIAKPFELRALLEVIERAGRAAPPAAGPAEDLEGFGDIVGFSPPMIDVYKRIARFARAEDTVLIVGETGVGKELVARAIHEHGPRAHAPFIAVDCGAVPGPLWESELFGSVRGAYTGADRDRPGVIESARGGSVLLDEIGEIPLEFQPKLLRFLQEREFRPVGAGTPRAAACRMLAATNRPLETMVRENRFRQDLFYRLNVLRIDVPPLRERRSDVAFLVRRFMAGAQISLTPEAMAVLERYDWPGNVRQLQNVARRLLALSRPGAVGPEEVRALLEDRLEEAEDSQDLDELERRQILRVLKETGGNKTRAAEILGIQRRTLYKKLARMGECEGHT